MPYCSFLRYSTGIQPDNSGLFLNDECGVWGNVGNLSDLPTGPPDGNLINRFVFQPEMEFAKVLGIGACITFQLVQHDPIARFHVYQGAKPV